MAEKKKENKDRFLTIREVFEKYLDNQNCQVFRFEYDGNLWAATEKKPCRVTIMLPRTVIDSNLKDLDKFLLLGVAIPRKEIKD